MQRNLLTVLSSLNTFVPIERTKVITAMRALEVGDIKMVQQMTAARRMGRSRRGYSYDYVKRVLHGRRNNKSIVSLHDEVVALRGKLLRRQR